MNNYQKTIFAAMILGIAGSANAAGWYNGDANRVNGLACEQNSVVSDSRVYEDFNVTGSAWNVTSMFGNFYVTDASLFKTAYYEVRSGVSLGNGGTLLQSGTVASNATLNGIDDFGLTGVKATVNTNFNLGVGTYHMTIALISNSTGNGRAFIDTTSGTNGFGTPIANQNAYWDSPFFGKVFDDPTSSGASNSDFSYGVNAQAVPEPASMVALAGIGLGLIKRRRK